RPESVEDRLAVLEGRQRRMTRFGAAAALLAVLVGGAALALGIINQQNAATKDDLDDVEQRLDEIQAVVKKATEAQLKSVNDSVTAVDGRVSSLDAQVKQQATTIATLQSQVNALNAANAAGAGAGAGIGAGAPGTRGQANGTGGATP
ncbi:MAG: hypothetical protein ACXWZW_09110, partial [Solirubrobacterales bacterium]